MQRIENEKLLYSFLENNDLITLFSEINMKEINLYHFLKGEIICSAGDKIREMYFVVDGKVKIYATTADDKRLLFRFQKALVVIGEVEFFHNHIALMTVEAGPDCSVIGVPYTLIRERLYNNPLFLQFLLETITQKFRTKTNASSLNLLNPVEVRFASYLLSISTDSEGSLFREDMKNSSLLDIADMIGTSYRHLNRIIQKLCQDDVIERNRGAIHIKNIEKLRELAKDNIYE